MDTHFNRCDRARSARTLITPLSHIFTRMSIVSLIYISQENHSNSNAQMNTQILRIFSSRFALEHRYRTQGTHRISCTIRKHIPSTSRQDRRSRLRRRKMLSDRDFWPWKYHAQYFTLLNSAMTQTCWHNVMVCFMKKTTFVVRQHRMKQRKKRMREVVLWLEQQSDSNGVDTGCGDSEW